MTDSTASVRAAGAGDRRAIHDLLQFEPFSHRHMDWKSPLDWLGDSPFLIAQKHGCPAALIACPPDPPEIAWIRAFATGSLLNPTTAWDSLWDLARAELLQQPQTERALAIVMDDWFQELLVRSGFKHLTDVLMLSWENGGPRPEPPSQPVAVRPMQPADLPAVAVLDRGSFAPVWHHSLKTLTVAFQNSLIATVSTRGADITGYQISTPNPFGGHLARLAVRPDLQRRGIGYGLLHDLLLRFQAKGALRVTVNTQQDNLPSLRLYRKTHFHLTGERYPIYEYRLR